MAETAPWDRPPQAAAPWARPAGQETAPWERPQDAFGAAAARTYQAVKPTGGRKESDVTKLPEEVTSKLATDLMEMPFRAASAPMRAFTGKLQVNDPETGMPTREAIGEAQGVAGMIMGGAARGPKGATGTGPALGAGEKKTGVALSEGFKMLQDVGEQAAEKATQTRVKKLLPEPKNLFDRAWDNYTKRMTEKEAMDSEAVWGTARRIAEEKGESEAAWYARLMNDWYKRKGIDKWMSEDTANKYMGGERGSQMLSDLFKSKGGGGPRPKLIPSTHEEMGIPKPSGLDDRVYRIETPDGKYGFANIRVAGNTARVMDIFVIGDKPNQRGVMGTSNTRALLQQFKKENPQVLNLTGERTSGARLGGEHKWEGEGQEVSIPLRGPTLGAGLKSAGVALAQALKPIERIFSPTTVSPLAGQAEGMIRSASGGAARSEAVTAAAIEPWQRAVNAMPAPDRLNFLDYVESPKTRLGTQIPATARAFMRNNPHMQGLADVLKDSFESRMQKLQNLPSTSAAAFIDDYFPHFWKDPNKAAAAASTFGGGVSKQGSRASLSKRTVPTISDGIAMGLEPLTTNPLEATMMYVRSMDHFIAAQGVLDEAKAQGTVRYIKPKTMGASGHPDSYRVPEGWVPLNGRGATDRTGAQAYAPEDFARVYNNYIDRGIHKNADWGNLYDAAQKTSNVITSMELGLSGYHAFTMANEAIISDVAKGISELVGGKPIRAIGSVAKAPAAPVTQYMKGKKVEQAYLGHGAATPDMRNIADLLEKAGGRAVGKRHAADYTFSQMGSYWTSFKRGALKQEMQQSAANIRGAPITGTAKEGAKTIGRIMETVAQPLFEKYIPRIKNGAFYDTMQQWIDAHPAAPQAEMEQAARQIWDSIDNRFGELVQDNIFWNKVLKQVAQLGLRSYSWNLGTIREIGGGVKDIAATAARQQEWSPRASYVVALPIVVATVNAVYQKLMSGKNPESVDDLMLGRTGGQVPGFGGRGQVPERASTPGYQKDVMGWYENWRQEAANKIASGPRAAVIDPLRGVDWKGDPIFHEGTPWLQDYFMHVLQAMEPISIKSMLEKPKTGSKISTAQKLMGIREAPIAMEDKPGAKRFHAYQSRQAALKEWRNKAKDAQKRGQPPPPMPANLNAPIYQE